MPDALELFRTHAASRPMILALALAACLGGALWKWPRAGWTVEGWCARLVMAACAAAIGVHAALALWYGTAPHYFDPAEPTMTAVGWLFVLERPLYHARDAAERYAHVYGPLAFIAHGLALKAAGPSIVASKMLGAVASLASLVFAGLAIRTRVSRTRTLVLTGGCALAYLMFRNYSFWTRPEPLQLLCVATGTLAAVTLRGMPGAAALGLCAGVLWNLKITGPLYTLPLAALLLERAGWRATAAAMGAALAVAMLPFAALPNVSLAAYVSWMQLSAANGLELSLLRVNLEWALFLLLPWLLASWRGVPEDPARRRAWHRFALALAAGVGGVALAAAKPGAGPYHLLPFVPVIAYATAVVIADRPVPLTEARARVLAFGAAGAACLIAVAQQASFVDVMNARNDSDEAADVRAFVRGHPSLVVEMAYGGEEKLTFVRPELVFRTGRYTLDAPAVQEHQLSGLPLPAATFEAIRRCRADVWLVPRGGAPFDRISAYPDAGHAPLFPTAFRSAFRRAYERAGRTRYFDVWRCRARRGAT